MLAHVFEQYFHGCLSGKWRLTGEDAKQEDSQRVNIAGTSQDPQRLFGGGIFCRCPASSAKGLLTIFVPAGNAKIGEEHAPVGRYKYIGRLDIAVYHIMIMDVLHRAAQLLHNR